MSNQDFNPQPSPPQQPPQQNYFPQPPPSPLTQISSGLKLASAETPGVNFTGGRLDAQPRDAQNDLPVPSPGNNSHFVPNRTYDLNDVNKEHRPFETLKYNTNVLYSSSMPSPEEAPGVMKGSAQQLATWGSPQVAGLGRTMANLLGYPLDFYSQGAFGRAYDSATAKRVALHREEMDMARDRAIDIAHDIYMASKDHVGKYLDILNEMKGHVFDKDDAKNEEGARQAIIELATSEPGGADQVLINAVNNGGVQAAEYILKSRWDKALDNYSGALAWGQQKTATGKTVKDASDYDKSLGTDDITGGGSSSLFPNLTPEKPKTEDEARAEPGSSDELDTQIAKQHGLSPSGMKVAREWAETGKPGGTPGQLYNEAKHNYKNVEAAKNDLLGRINQAASGSDNPDDNLQQLRSVSPDLADRVEPLIKNQADPKAPENKQFAPLAHKVDKAWKETNYNLLRDMQSLDKTTGKALYRVHQTATGAIQVANALAEMPLDEKIPKRQIEMFMAEHWNGDPKYAKLYNAIRNLGLEATGVAGQGQVRVTLVENLLKHMSATASPAQILEQTQVEMASGLSAMKYIQNAWTQAGGNGQMPLIDKDTMDTYRAFSGMNPYTREFPAGSPMDVLMTSGKPGEQPGVPKGQGWTPVGLNERAEARQWVKDNMGSADPKVQEKVRQIMRQLGPGD